MIKRIIGALYGIFLEEPLDRLHNWQKRFEKEFLEYVDTHYREIGKAILTEKALTDQIKSMLEESIVEFKKIFLKEA